MCVCVYDIKRGRMERENVRDAVFLLEYCHFPKELTEQIHIWGDRVHILCLFSMTPAAWYQVMDWVPDMPQSRVTFRRHSHYVRLFLSIGLRLTTTQILNKNPPL